MESLSTISDLESIINHILITNGKTPVKINLKSSLKHDFSFTSLDLAEFVVRVENQFSIDIFEHSQPKTIDEVIEILNNG